MDSVVVSGAQAHSCARWPSYSVAFEVFLDQTLSPIVAGKFIPIHYAAREVVHHSFCHDFSIREFLFYLLAVHIVHGYILI